MKRLTFFIIAMMCTVVTWAVTVDELVQWGGWCFENSKCDRNYGNKWLSSSGETRFERVSDTRVRLTGMLDDEYSFTFTLGNGYTGTTPGTPAVDGNQLIIHSETDSNSHTRKYFWAARWDGVNDYDAVDDYLIGEITPYENGPVKGYKITFGTAALIGLNRQGNLNYAECYDHYELIVYKPNATITDRVRDTDGSFLCDREYAGIVDLKDDGRFDYYNFNQCAYAINASNNLVPVTGSYDLDRGTLSFDRGQQMLWAQESVNNYFYGWAPYKLYGFYGGYKQNYLDGVVSKQDYGHHGTNRWVTNGGDCVTGERIVFEPDNYIYACTQSYIYNNTLYTPYTVMSVATLDRESTHEVELRLNKYGCGDVLGVYINADITPVKNADKVESYDLFIVEGEHSSVNSTFFKGNLCEEKGHVSAVHLTHPDKDFGTSFGKNVPAGPVKAPAMGQSTNLNLLIPPAELPSGRANPSKAYTFFVRTNYTAASGLAPTFHDMKFMPVNTGVEDLTPDEGFDAPKEYYTLGGVRVNGDTLSPGVYVCRRGNNVSKVVIK